MHSQLTLPGMEFKALGRKKVVADFQGGMITSDAGGLLLRQANTSTGILQKFANCFEDQRNPDFIEHSLFQLIAQRVFGIALGYEDLNDHEGLKHDTLLATLVEKSDPTGMNRSRKCDQGIPLAGKSTLNRLELGAKHIDEDERYKKIAFDESQIDQFFVQHFIGSHPKPPKEIILDIDATDDPLHGHQEGRYFHGYYGNYCYLPLYIFCDDHILCARLRSANVYPGHGVVDELQKIIEPIQQAWPATQIIVRGDSGFCTDELMTWCETVGINYILGLRKNGRLLKAIDKPMEHSRRRSLRTKGAWRTFKGFTYQTQKSWSRKRFVVGKAEHLPKGANPRFIVTNLKDPRWSPRDLYEKVYCARGDMENRIKEQQLCLFADRTSTSIMRSNQLRCWFSAVAYMLMTHIRRVGLKGTEYAKAQCSTIRNKLFKIGALVTVSFRRVAISMSTAFPNKELFLKVKENLELGVT